MSNKVSGLNTPALPEAVPLAGPGGATRSPAGAPPSSVRDAESPGGAAASAGDVTITDSASQLASLEQTIRSLPAVDPVRVAQFATAIEQGTYTVQPQHVADQLMQLEKALGPLAEG